MINQLQQKYQLSLLSLLSFVAVIGVFPFAVMRFLEERYTAAAIDMTLVVGMIALVTYAHYSKKIRMISALLAVFINVGVVSIIVANGIDSFLWVYPVFASTFILLKPLEAFCLNVVAGVLLIALANIFDIVSMVSFIVTIVMLSMSAFVYASHGAKQFRSLEALNTVDVLTGAFNRRAMSSDIQAALYNAERGGVKQLLAIVDLDYFKTVNDKYGHAAGDQVLKDFVSITTSHIRKYDRLYRFGGEEFVLLMLQRDEQCYTFIDGLRVAIRDGLKTPGGEAVTVSFGVAAWVADTTEASWLKRADDALYLAKKSGRDRVVLSNH